jgi:quercetin dioxygenase-like cupin family protein
MNTQPTRRKLIAALCAVALAGLAGGGLLYAREDGAPPKVEAQHILTAPVAGVPGKEVDIQVYTFPPGSSVPWHIHPGAQEFEYELEGTLMIEEEGKPPLALKAGEAFHLAPGVVHRGWNPSKTEPAKVYVVRIKPVGAPLAKIVEAPADGSSADESVPDENVDDGPDRGAYPGLRP